MNDIEKSCPECHLQPIAHNWHYCVRCGYALTPIAKAKKDKGITKEIEELKIECGNLEIKLKSANKRLTELIAEKSELESNLQREIKTLQGENKALKELKTNQRNAAIELIKGSKTEEYLPIIIIVLLMMIVVFIITKFQ